MGATSAGIDDASLRIVERARDARHHRRDGKDEQLVGLHRIAKEPHARFIIADAANDRTELARDDPGRKDVGEPQRQADAHRNQTDDRLRRIGHAGDVLQARQTIVPAQSRIILKQVAAPARASWPA
jgi:hypothetical protein